MTAQTLHAQVRQQLLGNLAQPQADEAAQLNNALRLLAKWRSVLIQNTLLQQQGMTVMDGPLKGMDFLPQSAEGCHIAKLLGCGEIGVRFQLNIESATPKQRIYAGSRMSLVCFAHELANLKDSA